MAAFVILIGEGAWTSGEIKAGLNAEGIVFGISDAAIRSCISGKRNEAHQVAWGFPPQSKESCKKWERPRIVFKYNNSRGKPDDSLDVDQTFRTRWQEITSRGSVREGAVLAFVRNIEKCSMGIAVTGEKIPFFADVPLLKCGPNAYISKDGKYVLSAKPGIPYVEDETPGIFDAVTINGDVGSETGDIHFPGDLKINGDVLQGFRVSSWSKLSLTGTMYGSATCAGDIYVKGGINAPGETIESGGNIFARFCENSLVRAFKNVIISDSVMHSVIETEEMLKTKEDRGQIVGGLVLAKKGVSTFCAGSAMGVSTELQIGVSPKIRRRYARLQEEIDVTKQKLERLKYSGGRRAGKSASRLDNLRVQRMGKHYEDRLKDLDDMYENAKSTIEKARQGCFSAKRVLPGVKVLIGLKEYRFDFTVEEVDIGVKVDETD